MSRISFGKTAYVSSTPRAMLDSIEKECSPVMTGDGLVCIDWDELPCENPGDATQASTVEAFLWAAREEILDAGVEDGQIGDVVFAT